MDRQSAVIVFESLSSAVRLDVYRLLVRAEPDGIVAGEIAAALDMPPSTLSFHLRTLTHSGLVKVEQQGRFLRYRANLAVMADVVAFLTENCCAGAADGCADARTLAARLPTCGDAARPEPEAES